MKLLVYTIITTTLSLTSLAQDLSQIPSATLPSPNASALLEQANVPVNLYSGIPQVGVPIYQLPSRTITVPIGLGYHAQGIKVHEIASSVGLGWTLNAGGAITRVMRGLPDEVGFYGAGHGDWMDRTSDGYMAQVVQGLADSEPDIFYFNFMGRVGKFVFDKDGNPHTIPHQNLIIEKSADLNSFTIKDDNGMIYEFQETESTTTVSEVVDGTVHAPNPSRTFKSTWYLTKVSDANNTDEVTFHYDEGSQLDFTFQSIKKYELGVNDCDNIGVFTVAVNQDVTIDNPKYLNYIESKQGKVEFVFLTDRPDLINGQSLDKIIIKDKSTPANSVVTYDLNYRNQLAYYGAVPVSQQGPEDSRLMIEEVNKISGSSTITYRSFTYNDKHLPPRNYTLNTDHWGYLNLEGPTIADPVPGITTRLGTTYQGSSKISNKLLVQADILKRVTLATGGHTEFEYEENSEFDHPFNKGKQGGGVRIKKLTLYDGVSTTNDILTEYVYSDIQSHQTPKYFYDYWQEGINYDESVQDGVSSSTALLFNFRPVVGIIAAIGQKIFGIGEGESCQANFVVINSHSLNELYDLNGASIGYGKVTELLADGSSTVSLFTNFDDRPDEIPVTETLLHQGIGNSGQGNVIRQSPVAVNGPPFSPYSSRSWERGLLKSQRVYDVDANIQRLVVNNYDFNESVGIEIKAMVVTSDVWTVDVEIEIDGFGLVSIGDRPLYNVGEYQITSRAMFLESTEEIVWDQNGGHSLTSKIEYKYSPTHLRVIESKGTDSKGEVILTKNKYAFDYSFATQPTTNAPALAIKELQSNNMNVLIDQIQYRQAPGSSDMWAIGGGFTTFKVFNPGQVFPHEIFRLETDTPLINLSQSTTLLGSFGVDGNYLGKLERTFIDYNTDGNLLSEVGSDGIQTTYGWDATHALPITKTTNSEPGNPLPITTSFEYKPLVGLSKQTDPNGRILRYEYDEFNRLKLVVDNEGKIVQKYEYKVVNEE